MNELKYLKLKDIIKSEKYPFTSGQLRSYLLERNENGLSKATFKIGKTLFFREDLFDEWIESFRETR